MTEKVTTLPPKSRRLPSAPSSSRHPATHQYHTAYPDAILVMICTWYVVIAKTARRTWAAAMENTNPNFVRSRCSSGVSAVGLRPNPEGLVMTAHPETISNPSTGAASTNRGTFDSVQ
ncbi:hypothetical protein ColTof4_09959 [Colletotrichum tofieldiae]|nr:hypothetical protein ColTof3_05318 [Colletotrichum tofieldiae]GKT77536.1 hypothetical protein ColTof4_09959 [Colletotrichum tofieldiae]GKT86057.1 hypothetical protein Ct61P_03907 [Colletotrichum tofieldiae]